MAFRQYYCFIFISGIVMSCVSVCFYQPVSRPNPKFSLTFGQLEREAAVGNLAIRQDGEYNQSSIVLDFI